MTGESYVLRMCGCGKRTVYARGMCQVCYGKWWVENKAVIVHGSRGRGYNYGCRCDACSQSNRDALKKYRDERNTQNG